MSHRYFAGMDLRERDGALCIWDKQEMTVVIMARTPFAIRFWLFVCKRLRIRVIGEIN